MLLAFWTGDSSVQALTPYNLPGFLGRHLHGWSLGSSIIFLNRGAQIWNTFYFRCQSKHSELHSETIPISFENANCILYGKENSRYSVPLSLSYLDILERHFVSQRQQLKGWISQEFTVPLHIIFPHNFACL